MLPPPPHPTNCWSSRHLRPLVITVAAILLAGGSTTLASPPVPISCGQILGGTIGDPTETDVYTFEARAGDVVGVLLMMTSGDGNFDPDYSLYTPDGSYIGAWNEGYSELPALPVQGTYSIRVYDYGLNGIGNYRIMLEGLSATLNGAPNCIAQPISCGNTILREIVDPIRSTGFQFNAQAGDVVGVTLLMTSGDGNFDPDYSLYTPDGSYIGAWNEGYSELPALPVQGTYTLRVYDYGLNGAGCFRILLQAVSATLNGLPCNGGGPVLTAAVSQKTHGSAGMFPINLMAPGATENRTSGPITIAATFDVPIQVASCPTGIRPTSGSVSNVTVAGSQLIFDLSGAAANQPLTLGFVGVADAADATRTSASTLCFGVLTGDANQDRATNIFDLVAMRNVLNMATNAATFRMDVDADGNINIFDLVKTRNNLNTSVVACP